METAFCDLDRDNAGCRVSQGGENNSRKEGEKLLRQRAINLIMAQMIFNKFAEFLYILENVLDMEWLLGMEFPLFIT